MDKGEGGGQILKILRTSFMDGPFKLFLIGNANPFLPGAGFLCWDLSLASPGNKVPGSHDIERAWEPFYTESISNMQINNDGGV